MRKGQGLKYTLKHIDDLRHILMAPKSLRLRLQEYVKFLCFEFNTRSAGIYLLNDDYLMESYVYFDREEGAQPQSKFRVGEGVLGYILSTGKPSVIENLTSHPNFVYRPGATDYIYLALVGYPIVTKKGRIGVLTLQNPVQNPFSEAILEELEPFVKLLDELEELEKTFTVQDNEYHESLTIEGISFSGGVGVGEVVLHHPKSWTKFKSSKSPEHERKRFKNAIREVMDSIDSLVALHATHEHRDPVDILETYKMFASDRGWIKKIQTQIQTGLTAEAAIDAVRRESRDRYTESGNKYLKGHLADLEDLANRLIATLTGEDLALKSQSQEMILVARQMGPAELLDYDQRNLQGVILEEGIHTSHMAIVARAMGVPVIGRIHNALLTLKPGQKIIVDGEQGTITINPDLGEITAAQKKRIDFSKWKTQLKNLADVPTTSQDGVDVTLQINAGLMIDLQYLHEANVPGIGLYRTEIPFMLYSKFPDVEKQTRLYSDVYTYAKQKNVVFRTLDLGGDKVVPYMWRVTDENPAMGWRAIRVSLDRPALLKQQLRAMIQAATNRPFNVMFPLVATAEEFLRAKSILTDELKRAESKGAILPSSVRVGIMLETPSIIWDLDQIANEVDFLSLGTNDLFQFFYACDRTNPNLSHRYDPLNLGFLKYLYKIQHLASEFKIPVNVCGEMARQPLEFMALLALGYRSFSMNISAIPSVKMLLKELNIEDLSHYMDQCLKEGPLNLREKFKSYAQEKGLHI